MKKKTFLVTGGTGFIGSNISNFLVKIVCKVIHHTIPRLIRWRKRYDT